VEAFGRISRDDSERGEGEGVGMTVEQEQDGSGAHASAPDNPSPATENDIHTRECRGGCSFVANVLDIKIELPSWISPTLRLQTASDAQISQVKKLFRATGGPITHYFEFDWRPVDPSEGMGYRTFPLPRDQWRYFVIAWAGHGNQLAPFQKAVNLVPPGILCYSNIVTSDAFGQGNNVGWTVESVSIPDTHLVSPPNVLTVDAERIRDWRSACLHSGF
jgi:hypothetical protein